MLTNSQSILIIPFFHSHQILFFHPASSLHHALKPDQKGNVNLTFMPSPYLWNCLSIISEWLIQKTLSINFSEPLILNHINNIRFPNLRKICLSKNDIDSIEGINLLWMPNLHELKLSENKISFIKSLRKCLLPSLRYMQLESNPIKDIDELLSMDIQNLKWICLQFFDGDCRICENLRIFLKVNVEELEKIDLVNRKIIQEKEIIQKLGNKYDDLNILYHECPV